MAEEDDSKSAAETRAAGRRKRPPVTIDLEAEAVGSAPAAEPPAPAAPEIVEPPASEPEPPPQPTAAATPEAAPPSASARLLPLAAAAIIGGVVGGVIASLLFAPQTDTIAAASIDSRFSTVASRLDALEAKQGEAPTPGPQAGIDPARIEALEAGLARLESAPAPTSEPPQSSPPPPDLQPFEQRLAALEQRPVAAPAPAVDLQPLEERLATLAERLGKVEDNPPSDPATEAAAKVIALTALRQTATSDKPFAPELAAYRALGGGEPALETLAPLATEATPSLAALVAVFPEVAERIRVAAKRVDPEAGLFDRLAASAGALVSVKPEGPVEGDSATAIVSRMEASVAKGDLAAALAEGDGLDQGAKAAFAEWAEAARRRLAIDGALAQLASGN